MRLQRTPDEKFDYDCRRQLIEIQRDRNNLKDFSYRLWDLDLGIGRSRLINSSYKNGLLKYSILEIKNFKMYFLPDCIDFWLENYNGKKELFNEFFFVHVFMEIRISKHYEDDTGKKWTFWFNIKNICKAVKWSLGKRLYF